MSDDLFLAVGVIGGIVASGFHAPSPHLFLCVLVPNAAFIIHGATHQLIRIV